MTLEEGGPWEEDAWEEGFEENARGEGNRPIPATYIYIVPNLKHFMRKGPQRTTEIFTNAHLNKFNLC